MLSVPPAILYIYKSLLVELIMFTLENQQVLWNDMYFQLNQGLPTGAKHSIPLANIFLTFIILSALDSDSNLLDLFTSKVLLWKRYIDDCTGVFKGNIADFKKFIHYCRMLLEDLALNLHVKLIAMYLKTRFLLKKRKSLLLS